MFKTIWNVVKWPFEMLKKGWDGFNNWAAKVAPGMKTKVTTGLGALGSAAAMGQQYFTQAPLTQYIAAEKIMLIGLILFTLSFWFRGLGR
jgi:hypothetical protein